MNDLNTVSLIGRLVRDAEVKEFSTGNLIRFSIATNTSERSQDGEWQDRANFFDVSYFCKSQAIIQYLTKGRSVAVSGSLRQHRWEKDGKNYSRVEINATFLGLNGGKNDGQDQSRQSQAQNVPVRNPQPVKSEEQRLAEGNAAYEQYRNRQQPGGGRQQQSQQSGPEFFEDDNIPF